MTEHSVFLVWDSLSSKWLLICRGCQAYLLKKPLAYELAVKKAAEHEAREVAA